MQTHKCEVRKSVPATFISTTYFLYLLCTVILILNTKIIFKGCTIIFQSFNLFIIFKFKLEPICNRFVFICNIFPHPTEGTLLSEVTPLSEVTKLSEVTPLSEVTLLSKVTPLSEVTPLSKATPLS